MPVISKLKKLDNDKFYTRRDAIRELGISTKTFYKYFVDLIDIKEDIKPGEKRYLYRGSTINKASKQLSDIKTVPYYVDDED